jgi:hypothetical protein
MMKKEAPKKGCFNATYPATEWKEVACVKSPNIPAPPRRGPRPAVVGNANDIAAGSPSASSHITQAIGRFENVTNVTSESGPIGNTGPSIANAYTLQINTDFFSGTTACAGHAGCTGWEQWVYWNTGPGAGSASMQYWLVSFNATCPPGQGWNQVPVLGISCFKNSTNAVSVPTQPITNMANWTFTGTATAAGDEVAMSTGPLTVFKATGDNVVAASTAWSIAEFNIFGAGGDNSGNGGTASFNAGASTNARTEIIYGGTAAPNCLATGFTAEMNNLSFGPTAPAATAPGPAVIFQESRAGGAPSNCAAATTIGDTHLHTVSGLFYDFQAAGDFTLAEIDPGFVVQTRQVSGKPTWPNATVNKAVAARIGKSAVAICLGSAAGDQGAVVNVDGKPTNVDDGQTLALPNGGIFRRGNVYQITSDEGNSVSATINPTWIDVLVGVGKWPSTIRGLLANANGNLNQIETRDHFVLTNPFNFNDLYHRFADSWRVAAGDSMLSPCGRETEIGIPSRTFYAVDLDQAVREKASGVCTAAGVKAGALFDACTLDVAVIGDNAAAQVFVSMVPPLAVATIAGGGGGLAFLMKWWWLLLLLLLFILWLLLKK